MTSLNDDQKLYDGRVSVIIKCRPLMPDEINANHINIVHLDEINKSVSIMQTKRPDKIKTFHYDDVYGPSSTHTEIYDRNLRNIVDSVLNGFNGTIFAYGQTGTGKTFTMEGSKSDPTQCGVIPSAFRHIFGHITKSTNQQYLISVSYLEIYKEEIRDLLSESNKRYEIKDKGNSVYVSNLSTHVCNSLRDIEAYMVLGSKKRSTGQTSMNQRSSRSHAIFIVTIECSENKDGRNYIKVGKLNLVDLAGSERQIKAGSTGERFNEATKINLSLSALGNVISALVGKKSHIPYRDSKLTRLLQDSLGGNAKTTMIANIGPSSYNYEETLSTLRYASRAKEIRNKPKINENPEDALLRQYQNEILRLRKLLENRERSSAETENAGIANVKNDGSINKRDIFADNIDRQALVQRIHALQSCLLGQSIDMPPEDQPNHQEILELRRKELENNMRIKTSIEEKLLSEQANVIGKNANYSALKEEVRNKRKKVEKIVDKYESLKYELFKMRERYSLIRQEKDENLNEVKKELQFYKIVVNNFVPPVFVNSIKERITLSSDRTYYILPKDALIQTFFPPQRFLPFSEDNVDKRKALIQRKKPLTAPRLRKEHKKNSKLTLDLTKSDNVFLPSLIYDTEESTEEEMQVIQEAKAKNSLKAILDSALHDEDIDISIMEI